MQSVPVFLYHSNVSFELRNISSMPKLYERRTKRRMDPVGGNQEEGGSSNPVVASTRELRPRGQKRP